MNPFLADLHEAGVFREHVNPRGELRISPKSADCVRDFHEDVHQDIFRLVPVEQDAEGQVQDVGAVFLPQFLQGGHVSGSETLYDFVFGHFVIWMRDRP